MTNEEKITRYLGKIAANTERIAKALEKMSSPMKFTDLFPDDAIGDHVKDALMSSLLTNKEVDE